MNRRRQLQEAARSKAVGLRAVQERRYDDAIELLSPQGCPSPSLSG